MILISTSAGTFNPCTSSSSIPTLLAKELNLLKSTPPYYISMLPPSPDPPLSYNTLIIFPNLSICALKLSVASWKSVSLVFYCIYVSSLLTLIRTSLNCSPPIPPLSSSSILRLRSFSRLRSLVATTGCDDSAFPPILCSIYLKASKSSASTFYLKESSNYFNNFLKRPISSLF
mmetsp:Transcript_35280/g.6356  ORF Transcript_35280/g.6356 Transcript_35280/m.6356 type:complete len:174 (+) Transcript_35280:648-1169(+)